MSPDLEYTPISTQSLVSTGCAVIAVSGFYFPLALTLSVPGFILGLSAVSRIHRYEFLGLRLAVFGITTSALMLIGGTVWHVTRYHSEAPPGYQRVNFADTFPSSPRSSGFSSSKKSSKTEEIPDRVKQLLERTICLKGYATYSSQDSRKLKQFVVSPDGLSDTGQAVKVILQNSEEWNWNEEALSVSGLLVLNPDYIADEYDSPRYLLTDATAGKSKTRFDLTRRLTGRGC